MTKKYKLSHAEREHLAMARNALKRAERVTNAQARMAAHAALQAAAIEQEQERRRAEIAALSPAARELMEKQKQSMTVSRQRFNAMMAMVVGMLAGVELNAQTRSTHG